MKMLVIGRAGLLDNIINKVNESGLWNIVENSGKWIVCTAHKK